jgi:hypothetical protein
VVACASCSGASAEDAGGGGTDATGPGADDGATSAADGSADGTAETGAVGVGECLLLDPAWTVEPIPVDQRIEEVRLVLDGAGEPRLAWVGNAMNLVDQLHYAEKAGGATWVHEDVRGSDEGMGVPGLAVDDAGDPHILLGYRHSLGGSMEVASRVGGTWTAVSLPSDRASETSSLARMPDGTLLGLYHQLYPLHAISPDGAGGWTQTYVDDGTLEGGMASSGIGNDLLVDSAGVAHVSYANATDAIVYASGSVDAWTRETVSADGSLEDTAIALDPSGVPHIAFRSDASETLVLASRTGDTWSTQTLEQGGRVAQLEIDAAGARHVAHLQGSTLRYATEADGAFAFTSVAEPVELGALSMLLGPDGRVWLVWGVEETLCVATRDPAG